MNSIWILLFTNLCLVIESVYIEDNGYKDITISYSENVLSEPGFDFLKLKNILTNASNILFHATKKRSYFDDFILVVPSTLKQEGVCDEFLKTAPKNTDIYVTDSSDVADITTQHSRGCGEKGEIIYLSKEWMTGNTEDLALQFVQQWSTFRYGVFPENPERNGSCIASIDSTWSPAGCYNIDLDEEVEFDENGLPFCYLPNDFRKRKDLHSSIMFSSASSSKMLNYCDGSEAFPHNPVAPTLHNRICDGNSVWSVIKNTEDFKFGRNLPIRNTNAPKKPTFRCFTESKTHLTIMIQDTDSEARSEIRYALNYFLTIIDPADFTVRLANFSSKNSTDDNNFIDIDLENTKNLKSLLESRIKLTEKVLDVCLTCGLRKAYEVSGISEYSLRTVVLIAKESSLEDTKIPEVTEIIEKDRNTVLHVLFFEDTPSDIIPSSLVKTVQKNRGRVFRLKNEPVFMLTELTTALLDASKNILHIEDKILVVHKKTYVNVTSDITDVFLTPKNAKGQLLYSMQSKTRGHLKSVNDKQCKDMDNDLPSPICGNQTDISDDEEAAKVWSYSFRNGAGSDGTTCSSLALLKLKSSPKNSFTLKGWLSKNEIIPAQNALVIYAEVYNRLDLDVKVEARISGPGFNDFRLELRDNGNGDPDTIKGDNIYSRYFTSFSLKGTYTVSIVAEALDPENDNVNTKENSSDTDMKISQTKSIGTFRVIQAPPKEDILPPNRVCDLKVISIDSKNRTVELQWTAPGDDYDYGKAKNYTIKLSNYWMAMTDFAFNLKGNLLLDTENYQPAKSGVTENLIVQCQICNINATYYLALQATDNHYNKGRISNIVQLHFNDFPSTDKEHISTTSPPDLIKDTTTDFTTTIAENTTIITDNHTKDGIFIEKNIFIIAVSSLGVLILIIIIINIIIYCCCCKKKQSEKPKKLSKEASLRPPHNLNIAYKDGSESSLNDEQVASDSLSTVAAQSFVYSNSDRKNSLERYSYHTDRSLRNKMESQSKRNDLGFKLVQPMPAYATSSLSRFVAKHRDADEDEMPQNKSNTIERSELHADDTRIYSLAYEYKMYFTEDWKNLEENMLNKVPLRSFNTSGIELETNGNTEIKMFQLPKTTSPKIYFIALNAIDKNGNEGKISNIVQVISGNLLINNLTQYNDTENRTETITNYQKDGTELNYTNIYIISGTVLVIIFLIIMINILIWILCFKKYKTNRQTTKLKEEYNDKRGKNLNSDENILQSENENSQIKALTENQETVHQNTDTGDPMMMYAKVQKRSKNQDPTNIIYTNENFKPREISNHKENDLGFV